MKLEKILSLPLFLNETDTIFGFRRNIYLRFWESESNVLESSLREIFITGFGRGRNDNSESATCAVADRSDVAIVKMFRSVLTAELACCYY